MQGFIADMSTRKRTDLVKCDLEELWVALVAAFLADDDLVSILEEVDDDITSETQQHRWYRHRYSPLISKKPTRVYFKIRTKPK